MTIELFWDYEALLGYIAHIHTLLARCEIPTSLAQAIACVGEQVKRIMSSEKKADTASGFCRRCEICMLVPGEYMFHARLCLSAIL